MSEREPLDFDAIEARANHATPGPWEIVDLRSQKRGQIRVWRASVGECNHLANVLASGKRPGADAAFIAAARTDIPALIAEVRRLREAVQDADDARHDALLIAETWEVDAGRFAWVMDNPSEFSDVWHAAPNGNAVIAYIDAAREAAR